MTTSNPTPIAAWQTRLRQTVQENPTELRWLVWMIGLFLLAFFLPVGTPRFDNAVLEGLALLHWYAREHVILCLIPAFLIAGAIAVFVSRDAVMKYLGPGANKFAAYGVASVSGSILAVCSCTVLPLFGGIYRRGAGLGPAVAFLYAGPAINVLAVVLTAKVLGADLGIARALGAVAFSLVIGGIMHGIYRREEAARAGAAKGFVSGDGPERPLAETTAFFALQIAVLVFANWAPASAEESALWHGLYTWKWPLTALAGLGLAGLLILRWRWHWQPLAATALLVALLAGIFPQYPEIAFSAGLLGLTLSASFQPGDGEEWLGQSWGFAKLILPLLLGGVLLAGFLLGRPGQEGIIPSEWVNAAVGGNGLGANFLAALAGVFMYFATLTEIPIVQGLMGAGMGKGPALALLLAGPALSLPSMLVIRSILGTEKTLVYCTLVVVMAALTGLLFGTFYP
ncbi:MAG: permease [Gammaproteobacteria bacterium RIFOXYA12_FULL_61_12]|nr:MAG: permease [Gammaproteobacteria bacterium RIFOXYD12_FULL_61_37]OGT93874.1 MAG: permease [Gammaproteobacteria bacterium RIFOXYA12_FULL_61_12]